MAAPLAAQHIALSSAFLAPDLGRRPARRSIPRSCLTVRLPRTSGAGLVTSTAVQRIERVIGLLRALDLPDQVTVYRSQILLSAAIELLETKVNQG